MSVVAPGHFTPFFMEFVKWLALSTLQSPLSYHPLSLLRLFRLERVKGARKMNFIKNFFLSNIRHKTLYNSWKVTMLM